VPPAPPILFGLETEFGIARGEDPDLDVVAESIALVRSLAEPGVLMRWDYSAENPHRDMRGFEVEELRQDADEAHYYLGMAFVRAADSPDRDQTYTKKGLEEFTLLVRQMPDSQYVPDARQRIAAARRKLAEKDLYVGRFYFDRGNYTAAVGRFTSLLANYDAAGFDAEALYYLGESLWRLEQKEQARAAFQRLVQEHSRSEWAPAAAGRLEIALVRTGPPPPKGPGTWDQFKEAMRETWDELGDTVRSYKIFQ
jgi:tetratricopeptide (TPR) repeat protein